jgi:thymidylate synthase ThyX
MRLTGQNAELSHVDANPGFVVERAARTWHGDREAMKCPECANYDGYYPTLKDPVRGMCPECMERNAGYLRELSRYDWHTAAAFGHVSATFIAEVSRLMAARLLENREAKVVVGAPPDAGYTVEDGDRPMSFVCGASFRDDDSRQALLDGYYAAERAYLDMLRQGSPPEAALDVLPGALAVEVEITCDAVVWRRVLKRCGAGSHPDLKALARTFRRGLYAWFPEAFEDVNVD